MTKTVSTNNIISALLTEIGTVLLLSSSAKMNLLNMNQYFRTQPKQKLYFKNITLFNREALAGGGII